MTFVLGSFFPADFRFIPSWSSMITNINDWSGWEKITMDWEGMHETSFMMTSMPTGMRWSSKGPIQGMRCTYIGHPVDTHAEKMTWLCVPEWSDIYMKFYWNVAQSPVTAGWCMKIHEVNPSWPVSWLCRDGTGSLFCLCCHLAVSRWDSCLWICLRAYRQLIAYVLQFRCL